MLSTAKSANVGFRPVLGSAIICPIHKPCYARRAENSFYKLGKIIVGVNNMRTNIRVS